ncbi:MAG: hypothetical protein HZC06_07825, partial [Methylocystis sp.]|nr:hypothetical protein [Methylocystis sp.]
MSSETDISAYSRSILETVGLPLLALDPRLTVEVVVMAASGWSLGFLELANRSHKAGFIDVRKQGSSTIDAYAYLAFHHGNED